MASIKYASGYHFFGLVRKIFDAMYSVILNRYIDHSLDRNYRLHFFLVAPIHSFEPS